MTYYFVCHPICCTARLLNIQSKRADLFSQVAHISQRGCTRPFHPGDAVSAKALKKLCLKLLPGLCSMLLGTDLSCGFKAVPDVASQSQDISQVFEHILRRLFSLGWC